MSSILKGKSKNEINVSRKINNKANLTKPKHYVWYKDSFKMEWDNYYGSKQ